MKYKCDRCNFGSNFHSGLAYHTKTKHAADGAAVFHADFVVDEIFDDKSNVENESRRDEATSFNCRHCNFVSRNQCYKTFYDRNLLIFVIS